MKLGDNNSKGAVAFNGKIHWGFALFLWVLIQQGVPHFLNPIPFLIGSVFPDCDHRRAPMGRIFPMWLFFKHRGFTHSLQGLIIFSTPVMMWNLKWGVIFGAGYLLHLAMDSGTPSGVKWIFKRKKVKRAC